MDHVGMLFNLLRESASVIFARSHNLPEVLHSMPGPSWWDSASAVPYLSHQSFGTGATKNCAELPEQFQATSPGFFQV